MERRRRAHRSHGLALLMVAFGGLAVLAGGCRGCGETAEPADAGAAQMRIPVMLDGDKLAIIDEEALRRPPDFDDGDRRAWRLGTLAGSRYETSLGVEVESDDGTRTLVQPPGGLADDQAVVFAVNRTGEVSVATVRVAEPFPPFHGRGGNRGRGGDPNRVREVKRIHLFHPAPPGEGPSVTLSIFVDGTARSSWDAASFARVKQVEMAPEAGEGERRAWSLRSLADELLGADYRATEVVAGDDERVAISADEWKDEARVPVLYTNRRGLLKFRWLAGAAPTGSEELREVSALRFERTP